MYTIIFPPFLCARCWTTKNNIVWADSTYNSSPLSLFVKIGEAEPESENVLVFSVLHCTKSKHHSWTAQYLIVNFCFVCCNKTPFQNIRLHKLRTCTLQPDLPHCTEMWRNVPFSLIDFFFFFASGIWWAYAGHKERKVSFLLLFANIWSIAAFHFQGQAIVVDRNLLQLQKSVLQSLKNSFPLSNKTMDTSWFSSRFVMSNITKGYVGEAEEGLNPRWEQMCEMIAEQTVWIGIITFTHTKKCDSEKMMD